MAAPGWYADPNIPSQYRWWDGAAWSGHTAPMIPPVAIPATPARPSAGAPMRPSIRQRTTPPIAPTTGRSGPPIWVIVAGAVGVVVIVLLIAITIVRPGKGPTRAQFESEQGNLASTFVYARSFAVKMQIQGNFVGTDDKGHVQTVVSLAQYLHASLPQFTVRVVANTSEAQSSKLGVIYVVAAGTYGNNLELVAGGSKPYSELVSTDGGSPSYKTVGGQPFK